MRSSAGAGGGAEPGEAGHRRDVIEALYRTEYDGLVRLAYLLTGSLTAAPDLVHDAFAGITDRIDQIANPGGYLRTAVVNRCRMWWRHRAVVDRHEATLRMPAERRASRGVDPRAAADASSDPIDIAAESSELWHLVQGLPERRRTAVVLRFYLDLPYEEVARLMGCRPGTAKSLVHRALAALQAELEPREVHR